METGSPIIVIGMHRSGTTMVVKLLEHLGVFFGKKQEINSEAVFFLRLNEWLMLQSGGSWDNPGSARRLFENPEVLSVLKENVNRIIGSPLLASFLGARRYLKHRGLLTLDFPWGWKDPRNTFLLPFWLELFPEAKVIHVYRNGIDVASSLQVRVQKLVKRGRIQSWWQDALYFRLPRRARAAFSPACYTMEGGFALWEQYMEEARRNIAATGARSVEVMYESFLADPAAHLKSLAGFCGLGADRARISDAVRHVKAERANAYRNRPELLKFEEGVRSTLAKYGY